MAKLIFRNGPYAGKSVALPEGKSITLGRNRDIELPLPDLKLSRRHCVISHGRTGCLVADLSSTNGTFLNGTRLGKDPVVLNDFDRVVLGDTEIEFLGDSDSAPLPNAVDTSAPDPFGLGDDVLPENVPAVPSVPAGALQVPGVPGLSPDALTAPTAQATGPALRGVAAPASAALIQEDVLVEVSPAEAAAALDPLAAALADLRRVLPPEPPGSQSTQRAVTTGPKLRFCDACSGSIPVLDWDLGLARDVGGHTVCKECLSKGVNLGTLPPPAPQPAPKPLAAPKKPQQSLDDILAGLEQEAVVVDTASQRRSGGHAVPPRPAPSAPQQAVQKPAQNADKKTVSGLGDEFEEIGG